MDVIVNSVPAPLPLRTVPTPSVPAAPSAPHSPSPDSHASASTSLEKDVFAVSDKTFSLYKDESGRVITRYVSLRDGTVTYIPDVRFQSQRQPSPQLILHV